MPGPGDTVNIGSTGSSKTVTMTSNVTVGQVFGDDTHYAGTIIVGSGNTLTVTSGSNLRFMILNLTDATLVLKDGGKVIMGWLTLSNSKVILSAPGGTTRYLASTICNSSTDVTYLMGDGGSGSATVSVQGNISPRSLTIQSNNSSAHTVSLAASSTITTSILSATGASSSNRLTIQPASGSATISFASGGSSSGQFCNMKVSAGGDSGVPKYIGSNSIQDSGMGWLLQDPPSATGAFFQFF